MLADEIIREIDSILYPHFCTGFAARGVLQDIIEDYYTGKAIKRRFYSFVRDNCALCKLPNRPLYFKIFENHCGKQVKPLVLTGKKYELD
jgi:hypothetical protein